MKRLEIHENDIAWHISNKLFIIREVNSDMPIYIYRTNAGKQQCHERDSNPQHPKLMRGALTTELPKEPQWSDSNISYKGTSIARHLLPDLSGWELLLLIVEMKAHQTNWTVIISPFCTILQKGSSEYKALLKEAQFIQPWWQQQQSQNKSQRGGQKS